MATWKKILIGLGALILFIFGGFFLYINLNKGDVAKIDDSKLYPSSTIIPKEDNAYYDFKLAMDNSYWPLDLEQAQQAFKLANDENWNSELAEEIVNKNKISSDYFNGAESKQGYQDIVLQSDIKTFNANTVPTSLGKLRNVAQASSIKSQWLFKQGKDKEAFDNAMVIVSVGQKIQNPARTSLTNYLIGLSIKEMGLKRIRSMLPTSRLSANELKEYADKLGKFKDNSSGLQETFRMEYVMLKNTREQMIEQAFSDGQKVPIAQVLESMVSEPVPINEGLMKSSFYYKPNETQKLFTEHFTTLVENSGKNCNEIVPAERKAKMSYWKALLTENAVGKILADIVFVSLSGVFDKRCQEVFSVLNTQIMLASQAYKNDNGVFPGSMSLLTPKYIGKNYDKFDGKDIIYDSKTGGITLAQ